MKYQSLQHALAQVLRGQQPDLEKLSASERSIAAFAQRLVASRYQVKPYRMEFKNDLFAKIMKQKKAGTGKAASWRERLSRLLTMKSLTVAGALTLAVAVLLVFSHIGPGTVPGVSGPADFTGILLPVAHAQDNFTLEPEKVDTLGVIAPDTNFLLTSQVKVSKGDVEKYLTLSSGSSFTVETVQNGYQYRIDPKEDLTPGEVLTVKAATVVEQDGVTHPYQYSWAFEVQDHFKIMNTVPANHQSSVALNAGIRIMVSHTNTVDPKDYISIEPNIEVTYQTEYKTIVIVPKGTWKKDTLYTIRIKKGFGVPENLLPAGSDLKDWQLQNDYVLEFSTAALSSKSYPIWFAKDTVTIQKGERPDLATFASYSTPNAAAQVQVYPLKEDALPSVAAALSDYTGWLPGNIRNAKLADIRQQAVSGDAIQTYTVKPDVGSWSAHYRLQPIYNEGLYLAEMKISGLVYLKVISVSDLGAYISISDRTGLAWAVDVDAQKVLSGVHIQTLDGTDLGATDKDGVLHFDVTQFSSDVLPYFLVKDASRVVVLQVPTYGQFGSPQPDYDGFMTLDQYLVHPDDTVRYWGELHNKFGDNPSHVTVEVASSGYNSAYGNQVVVTSQEVALDQRGFFSGEFALQNLRDGYYWIRVKDGDGEIRSQSFEVREFTTPEISLTLEPSKRFIEGGDSEKITLTAALFDGKPAAYMKFKLSNGDVLETDANGTAVEVINYPKDCLSSCNNTWERLDARPVDPLGTEVYAETSWTVLHEFLDMQLTSDKTDEAVNGAVQVRGIEYHLTNDDQYIQDSNRQYSQAKGVPYKLDIIQQESVRSELQTRYDANSNETRYYYTYRIVDTTAAHQEGLTDENGQVQVNFPIQKDHNYYIRFWAMDKNGQYEDTYFYPVQLNLPSGDVYVDSPDQEVPINSVQAGYDGQQQLSLSPAKRLDTYLVGSRVTLNAELTGTGSKGDTSGVPSDALLLVNVAAPNLVDTIVTKGNTLDLTVKKAYRPNFFVGGAALFGGHIYFVEQHFYGWLTVDKEASRLNVDVQTPSSSYGRGDEVNADVTVTDKDGNPVQGQVNVSVLDKAYLALDTYKASQDPLEEQWKTQNSPGILGQNATHNPPFMVDGLGGGGGDEARVNFLEQAYYDVLDTDANGKAHINFTLPDNITTWSIMVNAAADDFRGGIGTKDIVVTQPLQVEPISNETFLAGDDIVLSARAYADFLKIGDQVTFSLYGPIPVTGEMPQSLKDFPVADQTQTVAYTDTPAFKVGNLQTGNYAYAIRASVGDRQDIIIKPLTVVAGLLTTQVVKDSSVTPDWHPELPDGVGRATLTLSSSFGAQAYCGLRCMGATGTKLDTRVAWTAASRLLKTYFDQSSPSIDQMYPEMIPVEYKNPDGGYALYPFGGSDLYTASRIMPLVTKDDLAFGEATQYFEGILSQGESGGDVTPEEIALALHGLAALHQPDLAFTQQFAPREDLSTRAKLVLIDSLILYGDQQTARTMWNALLPDHYQEKDGEGWITTEKPETGEEKILTEDALVIAAELNDPHMDALYLHLQNGDGEINPVMRVRYWQARLQTQPVQPMSFVIQIGQEQRFISLQGYESFSVSLDSDQLAQVQISNIKGPLHASLTYDQPTDTTASSDAIEVTRKYLQDGQFVKEFDPNKPVQVQIVVRLTDPSFAGSYLVEDLLPSSLKANWRGYGWDNYQNYYQQCATSPYRVSGQHARSYVYLTAKGDHPCRSVTINYTASPVVVGGSYKAEGVHVSSGDHPGVSVITPSQTVPMKK